MEIGAALIAIGVILFAANALIKQRRRAAEMDLEDTSWLKRDDVSTPDPLRSAAPVSQFHVEGSLAKVTFDVPLSDEDDDVLNDLLVDEAVEVVRAKRHNLPIDDVTEIVVYAGRDSVREVGRHVLPKAGELPPPTKTELFSLTHVGRDPFAGDVKPPDTTHIETRVDLPKDELPPLYETLRIPMGLQRGIRARGVDPETVNGPGLVLALLDLFGYGVMPQTEPDTFMASKDGATIFIRTDSYEQGEHPELEEKIVKKFVFEFSTSGAQRGMLITDKYGPFMMHDVERREPRVRFITRNRVQGLIDSMALG